MAVGAEVYRSTQSITMSCSGFQPGEAVYAYTAIIRDYPISLNGYMNFYVSFDNSTPVLLVDPPSSSSSRIRLGSADTSGNWTGTRSVTVIARKSASADDYSDPYLPPYKVFAVAGETAPGRTFSNAVIGETTVRSVSRTCNISVNGGSANNTVTLPTVAAGQFISVGAPVSNAAINIQLTNCRTGGGVANGNQVQLYFSGSSIDRTSGRLNNDAGGAGNVQIGLYNTDGSSINLASGVRNQNAAFTYLAKGNAQLQYVAKYVAMALPATPGQVRTRVQFDLDYP